MAYGSIVDNVINRLAVDSSYFGRSVDEVLLDNTAAYSAILLSNMDQLIQDVDQSTVDIVEAHIASRANGKASLIGEHTYYHNPDAASPDYYPDLIAPGSSDEVVVGSGDASHVFYTITNEDGNFPQYVEPYTISYAGNTTSFTPEGQPRSLKEFSLEPLENVSTYFIPSIALIENYEIEADQGTHEESGFWQSILDGVENFRDSFRTEYEYIKLEALYFPTEMQLASGFIVENSGQIEQLAPAEVAAYEQPTSLLSVSKRDQLVLPDELVQLSVLFPQEYWLDQDGVTDIVAFAVQDRTAGGGYLTRLGQKKDSGQVYEVSIAEIDEWSFVAGASGALDEIGFNIIQANGMYSKRLDTGALVLALDTYALLGGKQAEATIGPASVNPAGATSVPYWDWQGTSGDDRDGSINTAVRIRGHDGDDYIRAGGANNVIYGDDGDDTLEGHKGHDEILGGRDRDKLYGGSGHDRLFGEQDRDWLYGGTGDDFLSGGSGDDWLDGDEDNDQIFGDSGNDDLRGGNGHDLLYGQDDEDDLRGEDGDDQLFGGNENDSLRGGDGIDRLAGESGNDTLRGEKDADELFGGTGDDWLEGGEGDDLIHGEDGFDTASYENNSASVSVNLFDEIAISASSGTDVLWGIEGIEGSPYDDIIDGDDSSNFLFANGGGDLVRGHGGGDYIKGGSGNDVLWGDAGSDLVEGGAGHDEIRGGLGQDVLRGDLGNDYLRGEQDDDQIDGGEGIDTVFFWGEWENFGISQQADGSILVSDLRLDAIEGSDSLVNIEYVEFFNGLFSIHDALLLDASSSGGSSITPSDPNLTTITQNDAAIHGNQTNFDYRFAGAMLAGDELLVGSEGRDDVVASSGNDVLLLGAGDQVTLYGFGITELVWSIDENTGRLSSYHVDLGYDQYEGEFNVWSDVSGWDPYLDVTALVETVATDPGVVFNDGDGVAADITQAWQWWDERFGTSSEYDGNETINGGGGKNDYLATTGDDVLIGTGSTDQYTIYGVTLSQINISQNDAGNLIISTAEFGVDQLVGEFSAWIDADQTWLSYNDLLNQAGSTPAPDPFTPQTGDTVFYDGSGAPKTESWHWFDERFSGSALDGDEFIFGGAGGDDFVASGGNDVIDGGAGDDQVTLYGVAWADLQVGVAADGSIHTYHEDLGYDIHRNVEAWWSDAAGSGWVSATDLAMAADDAFVFI